MADSERATFLVAEPLPEEGLSSRKLVLETAYFNVLTAYSADEAEQMLARFPNVDAVIVHSELYGDRLSEAIGAVKKICNVPVIALVAARDADASAADETVSSHTPQELLNLLMDRFGNEQKNTRRGQHR